MMFHWRTPEQFHKHVDPSSASRCVTRKNEVVLIRESRGAGETRLVLCLIDGLAIDESPESPTSRCSVFFGILDHDLSRRGGPGNESLELAQGAVVLHGRHMLPSDLGKDRTIRKRQHPLPISHHRYGVSENSSQLVEYDFVRRRNQLPLPVPSGDGDTINWRTGTRRSKERHTAITGAIVIGANHGRGRTTGVLGRSASGEHG